MEIKALRKAYYNGSIVNPGEVINCKGKTVPSWATLASGKESKKIDNDPNEKQLEIKLTQKLDGLIKEATEIDVWCNGTGKTLEEQIAEYKEAIKKLHDDLKIEASKLDIEIDNPENKTIYEQIKEYKGVIAAKKAELPAAESGGGNAETEGGDKEISAEKLEELITEATVLGIVLEGGELDLPDTEKAKVLIGKIAKAKA